MQEEQEEMIKTGKPKKRRPSGFKNGVIIGLVLGLLITGIGAGVGILVLFRANRRMKENIRVVALLYCIGVISGIILEFLPAGIWR